MNSILWAQTETFNLILERLYVTEATTIGYGIELKIWKQAERLTKLYVGVQYISWMWMDLKTISLVKAFKVV